MKACWNMRERFQSQMLVSVTCRGVLRHVRRLRTEERLVDMCRQGLTDVPAGHLPYSSFEFFS